MLAARESQDRVTSTMDPAPLVKVGVEPKFAMTKPRDSISSPSSSPLLLSTQSPHAVDLAFRSPIEVKRLQLIEQNVDNSLHNSQDTRSDALLPIRHNFDSDLSNYQESSNPSNGVPIFTEFMNSTNMFLNRLDKKLDVLLEHIRHLPSTQNVTFDDSVLNMFPLKDIGEISDMEKNLKNDEFKLKITHFIHSVGGTSLKNFVKRVLSRIFTNKLSSVCSWTGFKNNFRLVSLQIMKIVKKLKPLHLISRRHYNRTISNIYQKEGSSINLSQLISTPNTAALVKFLDIFTNDINTCSNNHNVNNLLPNKSFQLLSQLIAKYHISHNCVNELLVILQSEGLDVPKDVRSLLKTPKSKSHNIIQMENGSYIHIGVEQMIKSILYTYFEISFVNVPEINKIVLPNCIFHGRSKKPGPVYTFFDLFITEIKSIFENGIEINQKLLQFSISQVVCDAPAKAFVLNVKYFNAYHSCNSCLEEGKFINRRMSFLGIDAQL
ncbi:hypothetical protein QTP88_009805 [Uroleucon formosanum]